MSSEMNRVAQALCSRGFLPASGGGQVSHEPRVELPAVAIGSVRLYEPKSARVMDINPYTVRAYNLRSGTPGRNVKTGYTADLAKLTSFLATASMRALIGCFSDSLLAVFLAVPASSVRRPGSGQLPDG